MQLFWKFMGVMAPVTPLVTPLQLVMMPDANLKLKSLKKINFFTRTSTTVQISDRWPVEVLLLTIFQRNS